MCLCVYDACTCVRVSASSSTVAPDQHHPHDLLTTDHILSTPHSSPSLPPLPFLGHQSSPSILFFSLLSAHGRDVIITRGVVPLAATICPNFSPPVICNLTARQPVVMPVHSATPSAGYLDFCVHSVHLNSSQWRQKRFAGHKSEAKNKWGLRKALQLVL